MSQNWVIIVETVTSGWQERERCSLANSASSRLDLGARNIVAVMDSHGHDHDDHKHAGQVVRRCDIAVCGVSPRSLAAAVELLERGRVVIVVDDGVYDDLTAASATVRVAGFEQVRSYGGEILSVSTVTSGPISSRQPIEFDSSIELDGGHKLVARRIVIAQAIQSDMVATIDTDLLAEDAASNDEPTANAADWDQRYGAQIWSGNPNGSLIVEATGLVPGKALDVGAGEGADAIWLAEQGWNVTASDISQRALDRGHAEAVLRGLVIERLCIDANQADAFEPEAFDLVTAQYASIPRTPDHRALQNMLGAVAPGGSFISVSHDLDPTRRPHLASSRPFDPDAYLRVDDIVDALGDLPHWTIEIHERRARPPGAATASHHVDDVVLRAHRLLTERRPT